jgi:shikimate 5-dehydrogenase
MKTGRRTFLAGLVGRGIGDSRSPEMHFPIETELLRAARKLGCATLAGGGMAVHQAADAFRLMTEIEPSVTRMMAAF